MLHWSAQFQLEAVAVLEAVGARHVGHQLNVLARWVVAAEEPDLLQSVQVVFVDSPPFQCQLVFVDSPQFQCQLARDWKDVVLEREERRRKQTAPTDFQKERWPECCNWTCQIQ